MSKKAAPRDASDLPKCPKCNMAGGVVERPNKLYECLYCHSMFKP